MTRSCAVWLVFRAALTTGTTTAKYTIGASGVHQGILLVAVQAIAFHLQEAQRRGGLGLCYRSGCMVYAHSEIFFMCTSTKLQHSVKVCVRRVSRLHEASGRKYYVWIQDLGCYHSDLYFIPTTASAS